ncbi:hypothetical protein [Pengzhenrongella frigida]|uniref:Uncharacterized protein n=1 Tax=Pengzhenrongella frigida TaxID=1259133 RepID=A0A4Q5N1S0_9MICO|nr:hypothetical protein [Cellulomonas sp. HLT2-17]RYV52025.1 hypothetical protein EUA98_05520 [Cellulomonas sp. HLT2-17]
MSEHGHDTSGSAHSGLPLKGIDGADLHRTVDALAAALHEYIGTAVGVRAEFGAHEADEDPRVLALESRVGALNAELYDLVHSTLGLHADLTSMAWDADEHEHSPADLDAPPASDAAEAFHLGFVVGPPVGTSDVTMDSVLDLLDQGGEELVARLVDAGFDVVEWATSRGEPADFEGFTDEEDDDS